jgi:hypothetical protein
MYMVAGRFLFNNFYAEYIGNLIVELLDPLGDCPSSTLRRYLTQAA